MAETRALTEKEKKLFLDRGWTTPQLESVQVRQGETMFGPCGEVYYFKDVFYNMFICKVGSRIPSPCDWWGDLTR